MYVKSFNIFLFFICGMQQIIYFSDKSKEYNSLKCSSQEKYMFVLIFVADGTACMSMGQVPRATDRRQHLYRMFYGL